MRSPRPISQRLRLVNRTVAVASVATAALLLSLSLHKCEPDRIRQPAPTPIEIVAPVETPTPAPAPTKTTPPAETPSPSPQKRTCGSRDECDPSSRRGRERCGQNQRCNSRCRCEGIQIIVTPTPAATQQCSSELRRTLIQIFHAFFSNPANLQAAREAAGTSADQRTIVTVSFRSSPTGRITVTGVTARPENGSGSALGQAYYPQVDGTYSETNCTGQATGTLSGG